MTINRGLLSSASGLAIPVAYNFGLVRFVSQLSQENHYEIHLDAYLELSLWVGFLQVCYFFGANDYFSYLGINKCSKAKFIEINRHVKITLLLKLFSVIVLAILVACRGYQYWPLILIILLMHYRVLIHHVFSASGSYERDFKLGFIDLILFSSLLVLSEARLVSLGGALYFLLFIGIVLTIFQSINYRRFLDYSGLEDVEITVPNSRLSFFVKELLAFMANNVELFVLLYFLDVSSPFFIEYSILIRVSLMVSFVIRYLSKNTTMSVLRLPQNEWGIALRKYQKWSILILLSIYILLLLISPLFMQILAGVNDYNVNALTFLILAVPLFRSLFSYNIYFNLKNSNHILNWVRGLTPIVSLLLMYPFVSSFGYIGLACASIASSLVTIISLLIIEKIKFKTLFFE
ncbi:hypothetical protein OAK70_03755 [Akkermansiaceae bacterium]|nr:hypothetical protein [Akkermansiaceae bacterium]